MHNAVFGGSGSITFPLAYLCGFLLCLLLGWSCSPAIGTGVGTEVKTATTKPLPPWARALADDTADLASLYAPAAVHVTEAGTVITGAAQIAAAYRDRALGPIDTFFTRHAIPIGRDSLFYYEIGGFRTRDGRDFRHLVIRRREAGLDLRELELIAAARPAPAAASIAIDRQRAEWIERCNRHDAAALVETLYTPNTIYYNHRPVIVGHPALVDAYQYMNNPAYNLTLHPLAFELVNDSLAFEIGQCRGSYGGKYVLVWQRDAGGTWSILLDANR